MMMAKERCFKLKLKRTRKRKVTQPHTKVNVAGSYLKVINKIDDLLKRFS